jgi:hypothetical protein
MIPVTTPALIPRSKSAIFYIIDYSHHSFYTKETYYITGLPRGEEE